MLPHLSVGPGFQGLIIKPLDRYDSFHPVNDLSANQVQGFCGRNYKFFPTQSCISILTVATGGQRIVDVLIEGLDQFGFRASETVRITVGQNANARVGTKACYSAMFTFRKIAQSGVVVNHPTFGSDQYSVGIGRTTGDLATPPAGPDGSFRIPLLSRVRSVAGFKGLQSIDDGTFLHLETGFELDLVNQAIEIVLPNDQSRFLLQSLDAGSAAMRLTNT